jgi:nucleotide-binding universal stress UspA family protein
MIVSPKKILWPTDFSDLSRKAAEYARGFRDVFGSELHVLHVCPLLVGPGAVYPLASGLELAVPDTDLPKLVEEKLKPLADELFGTEGVVVCKAVSGNPWIETCRYARKNGIDLIIVATHGLTGLKHALVGSVAEKIVQHASCPVLTVRAIERDFTLD